jgi:hypothetical protein
MSIPLNRPVAVLDMDGCLVQSVVATHSRSGTIREPEFWASIWQNENHPANTELIALARALLQSGWHLAVLTARPSNFGTVTRRWLHRHLGDGRWSLHMFPRTFLDEDSGEWKASMVQHWLRQGIDLRFAIEDYRPNAQAIRAHLPVLLYERVKIPT